MTSGPTTDHLPPSSCVFITGGSGFLGRQLIIDLVKKGFHVNALARSESAAATIRTLGADVVMGDLDDTSAMIEGMQNCAATIHSAAKVDLWGAWEDFQRFTINGTANVLAAAKAANVPRFIHISTEAVLAAGPPLIDIDERLPLPAHPNGMYPKSKGMAEMLVKAANSPTLQTVIVRPRFIWGQGDTTLLPKMVASIKAGQWIWFGGDHPTSTCNVVNVSHGVILATHFGRGGETYFLTDGAPISFKDFISRMLATQGVTPPNRNAPLWFADMLAKGMEWWWRTSNRTGEPPLTRTAVNLFFSQVTIKSQKAEFELGYRPIISIEAGLMALR